MCQYFEKSSTKRPFTPKKNPIRTRQKLDTDALILAVYTENISPRVGKKLEAWEPSLEDCVYTYQKL